MSLLTNIDWSTVEDIGFKPLPAGTYGAKITKADLSNNKAGTGKYIKLELSLVGSKGIKGRKVFEYLTVQHTNPQVVNIALSKLKKIINLIGKDAEEVTDTSELLNEMVSVKGRGDHSDDIRNLLVFRVQTSATTACFAGALPSIYRCV